MCRVLPCNDALAALQHMDLRPRVTASEPEMNIWLTLHACASSEAYCTSSRWHQGLAWGACSLLESCRTLATWNNEKRVTLCHVFPQNIFQNMFRHILSHRKILTTTPFSQEKSSSFTYEYLNSHETWTQSEKVAGTRQKIRHNIPCIHQWTIWELLRINICLYVRLSSALCVSQMAHGRKVKGEYTRCSSCRRTPGNLFCFYMHWLESGQILSYYFLHKKST